MLGLAIPVRNYDTKKTKSEASSEIHRIKKKEKKGRESERKKTRKNPKKGETPDRNGVCFWKRGKDSLLLHFFLKLSFSIFFSSPVGR